MTLKISKNCSELMTKCLENSDCNKMVGNRTIHGFSVKREKDRFIIEMPFGQNGNGKSFEVADSKLDPGRFYINFGNYEDSMQTYVIQGDTSDLTGGYKPTKNMVKIPNNEKAMKSYEANKDEFMPLDVAQHLWMLGIDILGTEEQLELHFLTKGEPKTIEINTCKKNDTKLAIHEEHRKKFINAMYFMPNAKDIRGPLENMHEEGIYVEPKHDSKDLIKVNDNIGNEHIEKLPNPLPNIEFFLSSWVPENAANFSILLYHGTEQLMNKLGQKIMEIFVAFDGKNIKQCNVTSFLSEEMFQSCNTNDKGKPLAFEPGKKFLFWIKIHDGQMEISLNCNQRTFKIGIIPYSPENYIKFSGDLDLVIYQERENKNVATDIKSEDNDLTGKSPALLVQKMDDDLNDGKLIMIEAKSTNNKKIEIRIAQTKMEYPIINIDFWFENCNECVGNCIYNNIINNSKQVCLDSSETAFNFVFICNKPFNPINPIPGVMEAFLNKKKFFDKKFLELPPIQCMADYLQIKGDLEYPINANLLEFVYKHSLIAPFYSYTNNDRDNLYFKTNRYVILHLLWLGKIDKDNNNDKVLIEFGCNNCIPQPPEKEIVFLTLELNFDEMMLTATSNQIERIRSGGDSRNQNEVVNKNSTNIEHKNSFWLKIIQAYKNVSAQGINDNEQYFYKIDQNGEKIIEIESIKERKNIYVHEVLIDKYKIHGNIALFNKPYVFPYRFSLIENKKISEKDILTMKWRIMENAEFVEFFVVKGRNVELLGTESQYKFDNTDTDDKLYLHIRADKDVKNGQICISTTMLENKNCFHRDESTIKLFNPNEFKLDNFYELKLTFNNNEYATIQINDNDSIKKQAERNNFLQAEYFVINGDIAIIDPPKIEPIEKPTEEPITAEPKVDPPKVNK